MRRILQFLLVILLLCALSVTSYAASDINEVDDNNAHGLRMTYISTVYCNLSISGSGLATSSAYMFAYAGTDRVKISMYLQQYNNGWSTLKHWTAEADGTYVSLSRNQYVYSGYTYRVLVYFYAYEGSQSESTSGSVSKYY